jgi:hypothetical protein
MISATNDLNGRFVDGEAASSDHSQRVKAIGIHVVETPFLTS